MQSGQKEVRWMFVGLGIALIGCILFMLSLANILDGFVRTLGLILGFGVAFSGLIVASAHFYRWRLIRQFLRGAALDTKLWDTQGMCEKCGDEPGSPYTFLYGNSMSTVVTALPTLTQTNTSIQIKGTETVLVGDRCISRNRRQRILLYGAGGLILVTLTVWSFLASKGGPLDSPLIPDFVIIAGLIGGLFALSMIINFVGEITASKKERGEQIAISIGRKKHLGHNYFTTQAGWEAAKAYEKMQNR